MLLGVSQVNEVRLQRHFPFLSIYVRRPEQVNLHRWSRLAALTMEERGTLKRSRLTSEVGKGF